MKDTLVADAKEIQRENKREKERGKAKKGSEGKERGSGRGGFDLGRVLNSALADKFKNAFVDDEEGDTWDD